MRGECAMKWLADGIQEGEAVSLEIVGNKDGSGYFLLVHHVSPEWTSDNWFLTLEQAWNHAERYYGVSRNNWREASSSL